MANSATLELFGVDKVRNSKYQLSSASKSNAAFLRRRSADYCTTISGRCFNFTGYKCTTCRQDSD